MKRIEHMSLWERAYVPEIVRGLSVTGYHFWRNLSIHILHAFGLAKSSQADVTVQYPEERAFYPDTFRGRHRLTLGEDDTANCTLAFFARPPARLNVSTSRPERIRVTRSRNTPSAMKSIRCAAFIAVFVSKPVLAMRFAWTPALIPAI
jgi:hypothetical protein